MSSDGMKPDPKRVEAIAKMAKPANKSELQTILGMENYLSKFAPHPSGVNAPKRDLLKKDSEFMWDMQQETAFTKMKDIVTRSPVLVVDYYSSYPEVEHLPDTRAATVINKIKRILTRHGKCQKLLTDNGPQYSSSETSKFADEWDFYHVTSSPTYPQWNGLAERTVQTIKRLMKKAKEEKKDPYLSLLEPRNTPVTDLCPQNSIYVTPTAFVNTMHNQPSAPRSYRT